MLPTQFEVVLTGVIIGVATRIVDMRIVDKIEAVWRQLEAVSFRWGLMVTSLYCLVLLLLQEGGE